MLHGHTHTQLSIYSQQRATHIHYNLSLSLYDTHKLESELRRIFNKLHTQRYSIVLRRGHAATGTLSPTYTTLLVLERFITKREII